MGFYDEIAGENDHILVQAGKKDIGPKIVILESIFTLAEVGQEPDSFFQELELEVTSKLLQEIPSLENSVNKNLDLQGFKIEFFRHNPKGVCKIKFPHSS